MACIDIQNPQRYPTLFERRHEKPSKGRMTKYDSPMTLKGGRARPLPYVKNGCFESRDEMLEAHKGWKDTYFPKKDEEAEGANEAKGTGEA